MSTGFKFVSTGRRVLKPVEVKQLQSAREMGEMIESSLSVSTAFGRFVRRGSASIPPPGRSRISARASTTLGPTIRA